MAASLRFRKSLVYRVTGSPSDVPAHDSCLSLAHGSKKAGCCKLPQAMGTAPYTKHAEEGLVETTFLPSASFQGSCLVFQSPFQLLSRMRWSCESHALDLASENMEQEEQQAAQAFAPQHPALEDGHMQHPQDSGPVLRGCTLKSSTTAAACGHATKIRVVVRLPAASDPGMRTKASAPPPPPPPAAGAASTRKVVPPTCPGDTPVFSTELAGADICGNMSCAQQQPIPATTPSLNLGCCSIMQFGDEASSVKSAAAPPALPVLPTPAPLQRSAQHAIPAYPHGRTVHQPHQQSRRHSHCLGAAADQCTKSIRHHPVPRPLHHHAIAKAHTATTQQHMLRHILGHTRSILMY